MIAETIDGRLHSRAILDNLGDQLKGLKGVPSLVFIKIGHNPASDIYVKKKKECAELLGMKSQVVHLEDTITEAELITCIEGFNKDPEVHGILVQMPLPASLNADSAIMAISPLKDIDGLHPQNLGRLAGGSLGGLIPCTPQGCLYLLRQYRPNLVGLKAVVLGCSRIVGTPMALLLTHSDCTVASLHSKSRNITEECLTADILVAAAGHPHLVQADWIKSGAIVLDVGITRQTLPDGSIKVVGDVDFDKAIYRAQAISPVPGGVGPMTVACLMANTLKAFCQQTQQPFTELI